MLINAKFKSYVILKIQQKDCASNSSNKIIQSKVARKIPRKFVGFEGFSLDF